MNKKGIEVESFSVKLEPMSEKKAIKILRKVQSGARTTMLWTNRDRDIAEAIEYILNAYEAERRKNEQRNKKIKKKCFKTTV